jgi:hypothetical protein
MQVSDSDDEDKPDRPNFTSKSTRNNNHQKNNNNNNALNKTSGDATKKKSGGKSSATVGGRVEVVFKHEKQVVRERPVSAKIFREIAMNDPEFKVFFFFFLFTPLTSALIAAVTIFASIPTP